MAGETISKLESLLYFGDRHRLFTDLEMAVIRHSLSKESSDERAERNQESHSKRLAD
jgi:hypothetical protein